jgi:Zn-dependent protease
VIYKVDSSRNSLAELCRDGSVLLAPIFLMTKLTRTRLPGSVNDPNVASLHPFEVDRAAIPADALSRLDLIVSELAAVGFDPAQAVYHAIIDLFNNSRTYMITLPHPADGRVVGRAHLRLEGTTVPPKTHYYCDLLSETADGSILWSTTAKSTLSAPDGISVQRHVGAAPAALWAHHQQLLREQRLPIPKSGMNRASAIDFAERHHARLRDFHLARGVFQPMSETDLQNASAIEATYSGAAAGGQEYPEVFAEMQRLQNRSTGWKGGIAILIVSVVLFLGAGLGGERDAKNWEFLALIIPILLFHELGHFLAMKIFRYRNLKMFFIPFFGAAVSGQNYTAPGWKKVIVSLMGPLPGILLGSALGVAGLVLHHELMTKVALFMLILNGMNLLPVLPLDGGRIVQSLFFSRHYALDVAFRIIAGITLLGVGWLASDRMLTVLGIVMLIGVPAAIKLGRVIDEIKRSGPKPPPAAAGNEIAPELAGAIIARLRTVFPTGANHHNKATAQNALAVYESVCSRPPGWLATIGFTLAHAGSVALAFVMLMVMIVGQRGDFRSVLRAAADRPTNNISVSDVAVVEKSADAAASAGPATLPGPTTRSTIIANFEKPTDASSAFEALRGRVDAGEKLVRFGQTLMLSLPESNDAARQRWFLAFELRSKDVAVHSPETYSGAGMSMSVTAPSEAVAEQIVAEFQEYFSTAYLHTIPPWSPQRSEANWADHRRARKTFMKVSRSGQGVYSDEESNEFARKLSEARRRGDKAASERLVEERAKLFKEARQREIQKLKDDPTMDQVVIEHYLKVAKINETAAAAMEDDEEYNGPSLNAYQPIAVRMGQVPMVDEKPAPLADSYSANYGDAEQTGAVVNISWISLVSPAEGAPALLKWLDQYGCTSMKYKFRSSLSPEGN